MRQRLASAHSPLAAAIVAAAIAMGCGGGAKVGDCVTSPSVPSDHSGPAAHVVSCGSAEARAKLVHKTNPQDLCGADLSSEQTQRQYGVKVDGQSFCAQPK